MKKLYKYSLLFVLALMITACNPDWFWLNQNTDFPLVCLKLTSIESVEKINSNQLLIHPGGVAALKSDYLTQLACDITTRIESGNGMSILFRTVSDKFETKPSIRFDFMESGCTVYENNRQLTFVDSIRAKTGEESRIFIRNDARTFTIIVDCDTVYKGRTYLPATEYVIMKSLNGSKIDISGISFTEEYEWTNLKTQ